MGKNKVKFYASKMRKNPTKAEGYFWMMVKARSFLGYRFNRQFLFGYKDISNKQRFFIADFYCHELQLIAEIDGEYHEAKEQKIYDEIRTETLESMGLHLIRFTNHDVLNNWDSVADRLAAFMDELRENVAK